MSELIDQGKQNAADIIAENTRLRTEKRDQINEKNAENKANKELIKIYASELAVSLEPLFERLRKEGVKIITHFQGIATNQRDGSDAHFEYEFMSIDIFFEGKDFHLSISTRLEIIPEKKRFMRKTEPDKKVPQYVCNSKLNEQSYLDNLEEVSEWLENHMVKFFTEVELAKAEAPKKA